MFWMDQPQCFNRQTVSSQSKKNPLKLLGIIAKNQMPSRLDDLVDFFDKTIKRQMVGIPADIDGLLLALQNIRVVKRGIRYYEIKLFFKVLLQKIPLLKLYVDLVDLGVFFRQKSHVALLFCGMEPDFEISGQKKAEHPRSRTDIQKIALWAKTADEIKKENGVAIVAVAFLWLIKEQSKTFEIAVF